MKKILEWLKSPKSDLGLFIILIILLNIVCFNAFRRIDVTQSSTFSLSKGSKDVVKQLQNPLIVNVFFDEDLPSNYAQISKYLKDLLEEYKTAGNKNFIVNYMDMKKDENVEIANQFGIQKVSDSVYNNNGVSVKLDYRGIAVTYGNEVKVLNPINTSNGLEYLLTSTFTQMISSVDMLSSLKPGEKIKISMYVSTPLYQLAEDLCNEQFNNLQKVFDSLNTKMENRLEYETIIVNPAQDDAITEKYGFNAYSNKDDNFYLGLTVSENDEFKVLPYAISLGFGGTIHFPTIEGTDDMILQGIQSLLNTTNKIGYIVGHEELPSAQPSSMQEQGQSYSLFSAIAGESYSVVDIDLSSQDIPVDMNSIIICSPQSDYTEEELYKIDQFVMRGGNLIIFMDSVHQNPYVNYFGGQAFYSGESNLDKILTAYGINRNKDVVLDEECLIDYQNNEHYYWEYSVPRERVSQKSVITKNFGDIVLCFNGSVDVSKAEEMGLKTTILLQSSNDSWSETAESLQLSKKNMVPSPDSKQGPLPLMALVEGKFNSAFEKTPESLINNENSEYESNNFIASGKRPGKILFCGSSFMLDASNYSQDFSTNMIVLTANIFDYMNGNEELCEMKSKGRNTQVLNVKSKGLAKFMQYFNEIGIPLFVVIAGFLVLLSRKKKRNSINQKYNPDDKRTITK